MLGRQYSLLKTKRMGAMHLALFIKRSLRHKVTGIGRIMGNKGAVVIGLRLQDMKLLFINSHLAAHHGRVRRRNKNYRKIIDELQSRGVCIGEDKVSMPPDCVFWFGDLNYRINGTRPLVEALIDQNRFEVLQSNDQLRLEMKKGNAFIGFTEAPVRFPPTYKFDTSDHSNPCRYDTSKRVVFRHGLTVYS
ncbi:Endonuclease/exonuclease/phosphatase [Chytridium lagenaria]|nr:Endonuclease/exonuclease/phosphatase [Chytridium lagenaria]